MRIFVLYPSTRAGTHDSVLQEITKYVKTYVTNGTQLFLDLKENKISCSTISAGILVGSGEGSRPDLVILNRETKKIALMELTVQSAQAANKRKVLKYTELEIALQEQRFKVHLMPFKICYNGHIRKKII